MHIAGCVLQGKLGEQEGVLKICSEIFNPFQFIVIVCFRKKHLVGNDGNVKATNKARHNRLRGDYAKARLSFILPRILALNFDNL